MSEFKVHSINSGGPDINHFMFCYFCGRIEILNEDLKYTSLSNLGDIVDLQMDHGWGEITLDFTEPGKNWISKTACKDCIDRLKQGDEVNIIKLWESEHQLLEILKSSIEMRLANIGSKEEYEKDIAKERCNCCRNENSSECYYVDNNGIVNPATCKQDRIYNQEPGTCPIDIYSNHKHGYYKSKNKFKPITFKKWQEKVIGWS